jgi:hypothetical protein
MAQPDKMQFVEYVKKINQTWLNGNTDELYNYFSNDVVFASPYNQKYLRGKDLCIQSYKDFIAQATVKKFETNNYKTDLFDNIAIVTYKYHTSYDIEDINYKETNIEILVFKQFHEDWLVIWKTQMAK